MTPTRLVRHLEARGLSVARAAVEDDLLISEASRRNRNFRLTWGTPSRGFLVKCPGAEDAPTTLRNEAAAYRLLAEHTLTEPMGPMPCLADFDPASSTLVIEFVANSASLHVEPLLRRRLSVAVARQIADVLARLHRTDVSLAGHTTAIHPWVLSLHQPTLETIRQISPANLQLVRGLQRLDTTCAILDELRGGWTPSAVVHGDLRSDNILVAGTARGARVLLVDWELWGLGDPAWDLASIAAMYVTWWLGSMELRPSHLPAIESVRAAGIPIERIRPALSALWATYWDRSGAAPFDGRGPLPVARYTGARLLQIAFELSVRALRLSPAAVQLTQLAVNMLERPLEAAVHLLAIPLDGVE